MEIGDQWRTIQMVFQQSLNSSLHFSIATVNQDGSPHITPVGSLFLRENQTGYFFDEYSVNMARNFKKNSTVCILAVNSSFSYWQQSFITGKCETPPSVRLIGTVGVRREATEKEIAIWQNHVKFARGTKGYGLLFESIRIVRDIYFSSFEPVNMGQLTRNLWKD